MGVHSNKNLELPKECLRKVETWLEHMRSIHDSHVEYTSRAAYYATLSTGTNIKKFVFFLKNRTKEMLGYSGLGKRLLCVRTPRGEFKLLFHPLFAKSHSRTPAQEKFKREF